MLKKLFFALFGKIVGELTPEERLIIRAALTRMDGKAAWVLQHSEISTDGKSATVRFRKEF